MPLIQIYVSEEELRKIFNSTGKQTTSQYCRTAILEKIHSVKK